MKSRNNVDDKKKKGPKGPNDQGPVKPKKQKRRRDDEDDANDQTNDQPPEQVRILFPFIFRAQPQHADNEDDDDEDERSFKAKIKKIKNKIIASNMDEKVKKMAISRLKNVNEFNSCKELEWFEGLLKIPFGKYSKLPINKLDSQEKIEEFFEGAYKSLDEAVYGMEKAKEEIINYIAQFVSTDNNSMPRIIGLHGPAGVGKCLAKGTPVLMFDGSVKKVEDIQVGDKIMGDDNLERNVLSLGNGQDIMYQVKHQNGEEYVVNSEHILTLKHEYKKMYNNELQLNFKVTWFDPIKLVSCQKIFHYTNETEFDVQIKANEFYKTITKNNIIDIPIKTFLDLPKETKTKLFGFQTSINFDTDDLEVDDELVKTIFKQNMIPECYKKSPRLTRLRLLEAILGTYQSIGDIYHLKIREMTLFNDIKFIVASLGLLYSIQDAQTLKIYISQSLLETFIEDIDKVTNSSYQKYSLIQVKEVGMGEYYGFMIDGNSRFVLGNFIVTHNTSLLRRGLADVIKRPMKCISMGGIRDSAHFLGFEFTYSGSKYGCIVQTLIEMGVMNPIIFMDELDKISFTNDGMDVQNLLVHLTDPVQNTTFEDKYFAGIEIDLSKVVIVFSFNDINLISPILKDRIHIINIPTPTEKEKIIIGNKYLIKELSPNIGLKVDDIVFGEEVMRYLIQNFCKSDKGVRGLKRCIETIMLKINTARFLGRLNKYKTLKGSLKFPVSVTKDMAEELIEKNKDERDEIMRHMFL